MFIDCPQYPAQIEEFRTVQVECCDSRPSRCGTAYDKHEVFAPYKVAATNAAGVDEKAAADVLSVDLEHESLCI